jgi:ComF family protein
MGKTQALRLAVSAGNTLLRVALAPHCGACGAPLDDPLSGCVCPACWAGVEPPPQVAWPTGPITDARAGGDYVGSLRRIVHAFKFDGRRSLAQPLADLMVRRGGAVLAGADAVVPVPLHPWRRVRRGFNQAADLAARLGPPVVHALWRTRLTSPQADLTAAERQRNVRDAFALSPFLAHRTRDALRAQVVVLVDDVRTTGATLHACAEALERAGVRDIRAITAAVRAAGADSRR